MSPALRLECYEKLVTMEQVNHLLVDTESLEVRRVRCGDDAVSWDERTALPGSMAHRFFAEGEMRDLVHSHAGARRRRIKDLTVWRSTYRSGEYIARHTDRSGDLQLLIALAVPPVACGGAFCAEIDGAERILTLNPGDGVLFVASKTPHYTTALRPDAAEPSPRRDVVVARYYLCG